MASTPWILISVLVFLALVVIGVIVLLIKRKKKIPPDYYALFVIGLVWMPLGIALQNHTLTIMGLVFMVAGLVNKDKWKKNRRSWAKMDKDERMLMFVIVIILVLLALAAVVMFFLSEKGII